MDRKAPEIKNNEFYTIDIVHILKALLQKWYLIALAGILVASMMFSVAYFVIAPKYSSSILIYVNNSSASGNNPNFSINSSEILAAQSLVKTYSEILNNRTTLERVAERADLGYNYREIGGMTVSKASNDTEIMKITVTSENPYHSATIANCIAEILPQRISEIINGASVEIIEYAIPNTNKVSPNVTRYTVFGFLTGAILAALVFIVVALLDDTIHDEEYVLQNYDTPILAKIPDLLESSGKKYKYYYSSKRKSN